MHLHGQNNASRDFSGVIALLVDSERYASNFAATQIDIPPEALIAGRRVFLRDQTLPQQMQADFFLLHATTNGAEIGHLAAIEGDFPVIGRLFGDESPLNKRFDNIVLAPMRPNLYVRARKDEENAPGF